MIGMMRVKSQEVARNNYPFPLKQTPPDYTQLYLLGSKSREDVDSNKND